MTIKTTINSGILKSVPHNDLYSQLLRIDYSDRYKVINQSFEANKIYVFKGTKGTVEVVFETSDLN